METVTLSSKGQIVIPKAVREKLNLQEGARLTLEVLDNCIVLKGSGNWRELEGMAKGKDLLQALKEEREWEHRHDERPGL